MKRCLRGFLCALLLLFTLAPRPAEAAWDDGLTFIAVNVKMLSLTEYMPITVNRSVYVPVTVFDSSTNGGESLGVYGSMNKTLNTYTMFSLSKHLVFDLSTGTSSDYLLEDGGVPQTPRSVVRNGRIYVSASSVCSYFDLEYSYYNPTIYGYPLVRIYGKDSPMPNIEEFVNKAGNAGSSSAMLIVLNQYYASLMSKPSATVSPSPVPSPSSPLPPGQEDRSGITFQLAVRFETGQAGSTVLDALEREGRAALLFFTPEQLSAQDDLVRRAIGQGHTIGLLVPGTSPEAAGQAIEAGNRLLGHIGRVRTRIVLADGADGATTEALSQAGWLCWQPGVDGRSAGYSSYGLSAEILRQVGAKTNLARVTMDDGTAGAGALSTVLRTVRQDKYNYRLVVETEVS